MRPSSIYFFICFLFLISSLAASSSHPRNQKILTESQQEVDLFLLITGCGRSGTTYISEALQQAGLDIGHEFLRKDGCASWLMNVQSDHAPYGRKSTENIRYQHIFHQVRHPLDVISSTYWTITQKSFAFFSEYIPEIDIQNDSRLIKSAKYWYYWNLMAEQKAEWTYKIENIDLVWDEMATRLGIPLKRDPLTTVSRTTNHRKAKEAKFTWSDLAEQLPVDLFCAIQEMTLRYGYTID